MTHPRPTRGKPPGTDLAALDDGALVRHCQGLRERLDKGDAACNGAPDDATLLKWESAWRALLGQYERAVDDLHRRQLGE